MSVFVHPIGTDSDQLTQYIQFGIDLYEGNDCFVPPLISDDLKTLDPDRNPASDFCDSQSFMAFRNGEPVGAVTAIINKTVNEKTGRRDVRFGFVNFIDDTEVVDELFAAVEDWGRDRGMTHIVGPMGFTDMDHEGMLIEGFDQMGTMATIYNYPYYPAHMERMGYSKDVDWVEFRMPIPDAVPEKHQRIAEIVSRKFGLKVLKFKSRKKLARRYGHAIFELVNEAYADLYGFSPLTERQIDCYIDQYLGMLRLDDVCIVVDSNEQLVAMGIAMPSMSQALRRSGGRMWPFGWYHLLKAIRGGTDVVDLMLVAVKPEYQSKGVNALIFADLIPAFKANGYKFAESNLELEGNENVQKQWEYFERRQHRRRRAWRKEIPQIVNLD
ncbi:MAG: N-acetyltransferase [Muribaculaceae bacterium]|nr:N-acetyltransferase [Muribaculaceae bacterium]MDE6135042.1 N-acetyltransferase [Muribaculaceae bacterium]